MTPKEALIELLNRVAALQSASTMIRAEELALWSADAVAAIKSQKLIARTRPASSVVCPGCEQECSMPVHTIITPSGVPASFVVCDKRSDTNRVKISPNELEQWRANTDSVARFIADCLSLRFSGKRQDDQHQLEIGVVAGSKRRQMLCLLIDNELALVAGSNRIQMAEAVQFRDGRFALDADLIQQLVDTSTTLDPHYTPSIARREARKQKTKAKYERWRKEYRALKKRRPKMSDVWYSEQIAKMDIAQGRSAGTIKKNMK
jgi:hypothetical protein